jgi:hypothetical protein
VFGILSFEKETEYLLEDSKHDFVLNWILPILPIK